MKKFILFLIIVLFLTGCDGSYNLYISDNEIKENLSFHMEKSLYSQYPLMDFKQYPISSNTNILYDKTISDDGNFKNINMNYTFKPDDYNNSTALSSCFSNHNFVNNKKYYELVLNGEFNCLYGDSFDINIKTDNKVLDSDADSVSGNVYTWHVDRSNKDNLSIRIKIKKNKFDYSVLLYGIYIFIALGIYFGIKIFRERKNIKDNF